MQMVIFPAIPKLAKKIFRSNLWLQKLITNFTWTTRLEYPVLAFSPSQLLNSPNSRHIIGHNYQCWKWTGAEYSSYRNKNGNEKQQRWTNTTNDLLKMQRRVFVGEVILVQNTYINKTLGNKDKTCTKTLATNVIYCQYEKWSGSEEVNDLYEKRSSFIVLVLYYSTSFNN